MKIHVENTHFCGSFGSFFFFLFDTFGFLALLTFTGPLTTVLVGESFPISGDGRFKVFV
jgi:hypothetical protein